VYTSRGNKHKKGGNFEIAAFLELRKDQ